MVVGTKLAYRFMLIFPLLAIEIKATRNGNSTNDSYWKQKFTSLNVVPCNTTSSPDIFHYLYLNNW